MSHKKPGNLLLDLDGTLAVTDPDLAWALNKVLQEEGLAQLQDCRHEGVFQVVDAFEMDRPELEEAARGCPVNIISVN